MGKTIHSVSKLRHFGTIVDDTPRHFGGKQHLETLDGKSIPLSILLWFTLYGYVSSYPRGTRHLSNVF
jgi:hypothetical protein